MLGHEDAALKAASALPSYTSYVSLPMSHYLFPLPIADYRRCLPKQLWLIVVIFLLPISCIYRAFRATFTIKSLVQFSTLQSLHLFLLGLASLSVFFISCSSFPDLCWKITDSIKEHYFPALLSYRSSVKKHYYLIQKALKTNEMTVIWRIGNG